jgi:ComF family protein
MLLTRMMGRFLPRLCLLCEAPCGGEPLCLACCSFLPGAARRRCRTCARPWHVSRRCASCRASAPAFDASLVAADYCAPLDRALTALKFSGRIGLGSGLGALLADAWLAASVSPDSPGKGREDAAGKHAFPAPGQVDCIVPIPLSGARLADRGFNQAHLIASSMLHRLAGVPFLPVLRPSLLLRQRDTQAQSLLQWQARQSNLDHGFVAGIRIDGLSIGVVDDVMTTGATLQAAALALKAAGAVRIVNLVVARTA